MQQSVAQETLQLPNNKVEKLVMQGDFAQLFIEEEQCVTWQGLVRNQPRGVLSFALRCCY